MSHHLLDQGPNVVSEDGFKQLLNEGYSAEIVCTQSAAKQHNTFTGIWILRAVSDGGRIEKVLVTSRRDFKVREFKTTNGLLAFIDQFDVQIQQIPWVEGARVSVLGANTSS